MRGIKCFTPGGEKTPSPELHAAYLRTGGLLPLFQGRLHSTRKGSTDI